MTYKIDRGVLLNLSQVDENPWNPNEMREREQQALNESLFDFGQLLEVLVRPHPDQPDRYQIIDGAHRYRELRELGASTLYVNIIYGLSDALAKKLTIICNETRGSANKVDLSRLLAEIHIELDLDELHRGLNFEMPELQEMVSLSQVDWDTFDSEPGEPSEHQPSENSPTFTTLKFKLDAATADRWQQVYDLIADGEATLPKNKEEAAGIILARLLEDYLAVS